MRRKTAYRRFSFTQLAEKSIIVAGKVPRVQQCTAFRTEKKLAFVRQMVQPIGKFREQRHCAQAAFGFCFMLNHTRLVIFKIYGTVDAQSVVRDIRLFQSQKFTTTQAGKQQRHNSNADTLLVIDHRKSQNLLYLFFGKRLAGLLFDSRILEPCGRILFAQLIVHRSRKQTVEHNVHFVHV